MKIHFVFVGKTSSVEIDRLIGEYLKRLRHFVGVDVTVVKDERITKAKTQTDVLNTEAERIVKIINPKDFIISWDRKGKELSSVDYARLIERWEIDGVKKVWMITGSAIGLSSKILGMSNLILSLSPMTFPHDLSRLIIMEQTYRAYTIIRGIPYHR